MINFDVVRLVRGGCGRLVGKRVYSIIKKIKYVKFYRCEVTTTTNVIACLQDCYPVVRC